MTKFQKRHRIIATFFLLIFFPTILPNNLFASNNGPKSPEAASFEPVDATDMVNLITGQYSYVLPLLNVPSPEGGYPLALSYHAGIAMDQQASWTGLGWNLNPGAINRNVNGYPDDIVSSIEEYYYDQGTTATVNSISLNYSNGGASVGVGFNWGSNQSLGGYVSVGVGVDLGTQSGSIQAGGKVGFGNNSGQDSVGIGFQTAGGLSMGFNSTNGQNSVSVGVFDTNGNGFSISSDKSFSLNSGISVYGSSSGLGVTLNTKSQNGTSQGGGAGMNLSFKNTSAMGAYGQAQSGWNIPISVPTPVGIFSLSFGKNKFIYYLAKRKDYGIGGAQKGNYTTSMDINEIPISDDGTSLSEEVNISKNNITLPNYDNYNVQAQGLSGAMSPGNFKNGALYGLSATDLNSGYNISYLPYTDMYTPIPDHFQLPDANFYFENEISTYLNYSDANAPTFKDITNASNSTQFYDISSASGTKPKRRTANNIEYFTGRDVFNSYYYPNAKAKGYLKPINTDLPFNTPNYTSEAVVAFMITAVDGKTYHYSLPVYNNETITRTFGLINGKPESQSYIEKRQLDRYATHWLLTAVTGPDYIDNGDGIAGKGDLGYWVNFEYGKWTDAFAWKAPYKKDYIVDKTNPNVKTWVKGTKQLYYLDRVVTRTHTALFVKSERTYEDSPQWAYRSVNHNNNVVQNEGNYNSANNLNFTLPAQHQLKLDKIILVKSDDDILNKSINQQSTGPLEILIPQSRRIRVNVNYNCKNNVIDNLDNWPGLLSKAVKVIDFTYDYSLVPGDNRLTLKKVDFKGKSNNTVLPPYKFEYYNDTQPFNIENQDGWGYLLNNPQAFSLSKIITPQGGSININYETNKYISSVPHALLFNSLNTTNFTADYNINPTANPIKATINIGPNQSQNFYPITIGQIVKIYYNNVTLSSAYGDYSLIYDGNGYISQNLGNGKYEITFNGPLVASGTGAQGIGYQYISLGVKMDFTNVPFFGGGIRVKNLKVSDGIDNYFTDYKYGKNEDGIGYVSYIPYAPNSLTEAAYSSELPAPRVMHEYVTISSHKENRESNGKIQYKFNVMKEKSPDKIKYGDFYEISKSTKSFTNTRPNNNGISQINMGSYTIKNNLASIGQLLEVTTFNKNGQIMSKITNDYYKTTDAIPNNLGLKQESFQSYKQIHYYNGSTDQWIINSSTKATFPSLLKSSTEQRNGYTYRTQFSGYDPISGISNEQTNISSDGQAFKSKTIPAYLKYQQMGSKSADINNKNMLSQTAANYSYILQSGIWKEIGVGITTWSNLWKYKDISGAYTEATGVNEKIWRKHKTYVWNGSKDANGIFNNYNNINTDDYFNWNLPNNSGENVTQPAQWKQISEITLYNKFSNILELKDINGNFLSTKMGDNDTKVTTVGNAAYGEMFFAGAENSAPTSFPNYIEPEVSMVNAARNSSYFHTGKFSVAATSNSQFGVVMKANEHKAGKYRVSVWVEKANASKVKIKNNDALIDFKESYVAGNWILKSGYVDITSGTHSIYLVSADSSIVYLDDLMIRPISSSITGYVYNEWDELTYIIGNNGLATRFEYDAAGRLIKTYSEVLDDTANQVTGGFKLSKTNTYNNRYLN